MDSLLIIDNKALKSKLENTYNTNKEISSFLTSSDDYIEHIIGHQPHYVILEESYEFVSSFFLIIQILKKSTHLGMEIYVLSDSADPKLQEQINNLNNKHVQIISENQLQSMISKRQGGDSHSKADKNSKILYISENKFMHFVIKDALKDHRVTLIEALNFNEGIQKAELFQPDLIITDLELSDINGFDLCEKIHNNPEVKHIPVVIYSSNSDEACIQKAFDVGAKSYIIKKFHHDNLASKILRNLK